jgi:NADH-quinone oxidoreductase subunit L
MTVPLIILAVGAFFVGFLNLPGIFGGHLQVSHWLAPSLTETHPHVGIGVELLAIFAGVAAFAIGIYIAYRKFNEGAPEPEYQGFARFGFLEPKVVDLPVRLSARLYRWGGNAFKALQVGYVRVYAIYMVIGLSLMSLFLSQSIN